MIHRRVRLVVLAEDLAVPSEYQSRVRVARIVDSFPASDNQVDVVRIGGF